MAKSQQKLFHFDISRKKKKKKHTLKLSLSCLTNELIINIRRVKYDSSVR